MPAIPLKTKPDQFPKSGDGITIYNAPAAQQSSGGGGGITQDDGDARYVRLTELRNSSAGVADAGKPVKLDGNGLLANNMLDAELAAIAGLTSAANALAYYTGAGTAALTTLSSFGRSLIDDADQAAARATIGAQQAADALAAIATLTPSANQLPYYTGAAAAALTSITAYARSLLAAANAEAAQAILGITDAPNTLQSLYN